MPDAFTRVNAGELIRAELINFLLGKVAEYQP
jgi:hypothetical protein